MKAPFDSLELARKLGPRLARGWGFDCALSRTVSVPGLGRPVKVELHAGPLRGPWRVWLEVEATRGALAAPRFKAFLSRPNLRGQ